MLAVAENVLVAVYWMIMERVLLHYCITEILTREISQKITENMHDSRGGRCLSINKCSDRI